MYLFSHCTCSFAFTCNRFNGTPAQFLHALTTNSFSRKQITFLLESHSSLVAHASCRATSTVTAHRCGPFRRRAEAEHSSNEEARPGPAQQGLPPQRPPQLGPDSAPRAGGGTGRGGAGPAAPHLSGTAPLRWTPRAATPPAKPRRSGPARPHSPEGAGGRASRAGPRAALPPPPPPPPPRHGPAAPGAAASHAPAARRCCSAPWRHGGASALRERDGRWPKSECPENRWASLGVWVHCGSTVTTAAHVSVLGDEAKQLSSMTSVTALLFPVCPSFQFAAGVLWLNAVYYKGRLVLSTSCRWARVMWGQELPQALPTEIPSHVMATGFPAPHALMLSGIKASLGSACMGTTALCYTLTTQLG